MPHSPTQETRAYKLIKRLGGAKEVASGIGYGRNVVTQWYRKGIPFKAFVPIIEWAGRTGRNVTHAQLKATRHTPAHQRRAVESRQSAHTPSQ